ASSFFERDHRGRLVCRFGKNRDEGCDSDRGKDAQDNESPPLKKDGPIFEKMSLDLRFLSPCQLFGYSPPFGHQKKDSFATTTSSPRRGGSGSFPETIRLKLAICSVSLPSGPRCLIRIEWDARSVKPPAFAITASNVIRSSLSNSSAPGFL